MAKLKIKELAQQAALRGDTDGAIAQYSAILAEGDVAAAASLCEIEAFRWQWPALLEHAGAFLRKPNSVYAINVFTDVTNLVAVAGLVNGGWPEIEAEAKAIRKHLLSRKDLKGYADGSDVSSTGLDQLIKLAKTRGKAEYVWDWGNHTTLTEDARAVKFDEAAAELAQDKKAFKNATERRNHLLALADAYGSFRSAVRLYDEGGLGGIEGFDSYLFTASALARAGRGDEAWKIVEENLPLWFPVDDAQVAPVELLTDPGLRPLLTPERRAWVLRTPRGAEADFKPAEAKNRPAKTAGPKKGKQR